jgi:hypothetical protein
MNAAPATVRKPMVGVVNSRIKSTKAMHNEDDAKPVDGQCSQTIKGQQQADHANKTCHPATRAGKLDQDGLNPNRQQQEDQVGIDEAFSTCSMKE